MKGPGYLLVMEYLDMRRCSDQSLLGQQLARLHLYNKDEADMKVKKFGFHTETCCGFLPQSNKWSVDWVNYYTEKVCQYNGTVMIL